MVITKPTTTGVLAARSATSTLGQTVRANSPRVLCLSGGENTIYRAGGTPVTMSAYGREDGIVDALAGVDGLLLTGGGDVTPSAYKHPRNKATYGTSKWRDDAEWAAIYQAWKLGIPVLGICRGLQMLNVVYGGTLHQHLPDRPNAGRYHLSSMHRVNLRKDSRVARAVGSNVIDEVVSIHHQAAAKLGRGLVATGWSKDGTVEVIESTDEPFRMGVQFHPELDDGMPYARAIFGAFMEAAALHAGVPAPTADWSEPEPVSAHQDTYKGWWDDELGAMWDGDSLSSDPYEVTCGAEGWRITPPTAKDARGKVERMWVCHRCDGLRFDHEDDYLDHMEYLHYVG